MSEWLKAVVVKHVQHHEDYNVKGDDNPPWTRTLRFEDGTEREFNWGHLCRDMTGEHNTRVGMTVWTQADWHGVTWRAPKGR